MLADDFGRRISFDAFCAEVPATHNAFWVEHVNGVVGHALHQQTELLLAFLEGLLGFLSLGQVSRDLGKADNFA